MARRRGRRVRPLAAQARPRDRPRDERRARPPRDLRLAPGARGDLPRLPRRGPHGWSSGTARRSSRWSRTASRPSPTTRRTPAPTPGGVAFRWRGHEVALRVPGAHNALNAAGGARGGAPRGRGPRGGGRGARATSTGPPAASSRSARRRRARASTTTTPTIRPRSRATLEAARTPPPRAASSPRSSPTSTRGRPRSIASSAPRSRWRTSSVVLDVYPSRERAEDHPGVSGLLVAEAAADAAAGRPVAWMPSFADAERVPARDAAPRRPLPRAGRRRRRRARPRPGGGRAMSVERPAGVRARLARSPATPRSARAVRRSGSRASASEDDLAAAPALGARGGPGGRGRGLRVESPGGGRGRPRTRDQARPRPGHHRAGRHRHPLRRRRPPARGLRRGGPRRA